MKMPIMPWDQDVVVDVSSAESRGLHGHFAMSVISELLLTSCRTLFIWRRIGFL